MAAMADHVSPLGHRENPAHYDINSKTHQAPRVDPEKHDAARFRRISLAYSNDDSHASALRLILTLKPEWEAVKETIGFVRFTDGITNTVGNRQFKA